MASASLADAEEGVSAIVRRFADRRAEGRSALVVYATAGFPDAETTVPLLVALADAGADILELGIPFSDPLADGPTIQRSSHVALERGMTVRRALACLREFRAVRDTPVVVFTYLNPVLRYGVEGFCADALDAGANGLLLTDLPVGSDAALEGTVGRSGLDLVRLVAPTTPLARIREIAQEGSGFLYYISQTGVTGTEGALPEALAAEVRAVRANVRLPVAVGFGIATPEQAAAVGGLADGVVVGSALIRRLEEDGVEGAAGFIATLRGAMDVAGGAAAREA
jgi:tryptophan synthase alpha chain